MGIYQDSILPRLLSFGMRGKYFQGERPRCVAAATGRVLEVGFGSGLNLPHYGAGVQELLALDPSTVGRKLARKRLSAAPFPVTFIDLDGEDIPLESASVDTVTSTWTLCSIPDVAHALIEIRRVLKPSGSFHYLEHGHSPDARTAVWQRRLEPMQKRFLGGCHLTRRIEELVSAAGFELASTERYYGEGPRYASYLYLGVARPQAN